MKLMIALSALVACCTSQVPYPGFPAGPYATAYVNGYAPAYGYTTYGANALPTRSALPAAAHTALDVFAPYAAPLHYAGQVPFFGSPYFYPAVAADAEPAAVAIKTAAPEEEEDVAVDEANEEDTDVAVVEADETPFQPSGPVLIRQIFPVFPSDLRDSSDTIVFARPDQIVPVNPANVVKEDADELPAVVVGARSLLPSGIVQATQPRFYAPQPGPILAF